MRAEPNMDASWTDVCSIDDIWPNTGVACLLGGQQIAVFRAGDQDHIYALDNYDPFSRANVIARGIVGSREGQPKVASPMYKQTFCLETGQCFDDPTVSLAVYPVRIEGRRVLVRTSAMYKLRPRNSDLLRERGA